MSDRHGTPIWYELMTQDPMAARRFYSAVVGWQIDEFAPAESTMDYRMISASDGLVGGVFRLTEDMCRHGAWHELHAADGPKATDVYCALFGWRKSRAMNMGPMGTYQLIEAGGHDLGS
jgi:predicted enzyme related to lactoylglutathione lyase